MSAWVREASDEPEVDNAIYTYLLLAIDSCIVGPLVPYEGWPTSSAGAWLEA